MNILVLNASPKGKQSTTVHTALYLEALHPEHTFTFVPVGQRIKSYEKDFTPLRKELEKAELILFSYPVYTFIAPYQLHRLMELIKADGVDLSGKFASQITTSKHFYDVTAHRYIEDNCRDLGLRVIRGLSADMEDLLTEKGRRDAAAFLEYAIWCVENGVCEPAPAPQSTAPVPPAPTFAPVETTDGYDVAIGADLREGDERLRAMIDSFIAACPAKTRLVNIADYPFKGGCLGCFHCAGDGKCVYPDGFDAFLREKIQKADAIVYAFTVRDHSMGPTFKTYDDRQFCNGHRTVTEGSPVGYIVNGDLAAEENLRMVIEARAQVGGNFLAGVATDAETLAALIRRLTYALANRYAPPRNFYGVGGMKIFRDLIWLMRVIMKADHEFYKAHGVYDFPQKQRGKMLKMCFLGALVRNPRVKAKMGNKMNEGMVAPYRKVLAQARPKT